MGNEQSSEGRNNKFIKSGLDINESSFGYCENSSSYKGMKTDTEKLSHNDSSDISEKTTEQTIELDDTKIPYTFEWKEGGTRVLLTGQFVNWNQFFEMTKDERGVFITQITLPRQTFMFKFIVDGTWKFSSHYPTKDDGSYNINNVVDLSKIEWVKPSVPTPDTKRVVGPSSESLVKKDKEEYGVVFPSRREMNTDAPHIPIHYVNPFRVNCNTNQNVIGRKKYLECFGGYNIDENNCYRQILNTPHVNLNHLITGIEAKKRFVKVGYALRYRQKETTFIYYKPKKEVCK